MVCKTLKKILQCFSALGLLPSIRLENRGALVSIPDIRASDTGTGVKFPYGLEMAYDLSERSFEGVGGDAGMAAIIATLGLSLDLVAFDVIFSLPL